MLWCFAAFLKMFETPSKKRSRQTTLDFFASSPSKTECRKFADESEGSHKKLRSQYSSEAAVRAFYQQLEIDKAKQVEQREDCATFFLLSPGPNFIIVRAVSHHLELPRGGHLMSKNRAIL